MVTIDQSITIGNIIEVLGVLGGLGVILIRQSLNADNVKKTITEMKLELNKLAQVITNLAVTDSRLTNLEEDFRELRKGRGFISHDVNGEYSKREKITK